MKNPAPPPVLTVEDRKNDALLTLSGLYARNAMPLEEYERLADYITKAETGRELVVIERLVEETKREAEERLGAAPGRPSRAEPANDDDDEEHGPLDYANISLFSDREVAGRDLPKGAASLALFGSIRMNLADGSLAWGERRSLNVFSIFGGIHISVPRGTKVKIKVIPVFGEAKVKKRARDLLDPKGKTELVINGFSLFGEVTVDVAR
jgi:hypothetical protein